MAIVGIYPQGAVPVRWGWGGHPNAVADEAGTPREVALELTQSPSPHRFL